jgi:hypothetical protein
MIIKNAPTQLSDLQWHFKLKAYSKTKVVLACRLSLKEYCSAIGNQLISNLNVEVHSPGADREGVVRSGAEGASEAGRRGARVEGDQLLEDEQPLKAAVGDGGEPAEGVGPSQYRKVHEQDDRQGRLQGLHRHGVLRAGRSGH